LLGWGGSNKTPICGVDDGDSAFFSSELFPLNPNDPISKIVSSFQATVARAANRYPKSFPLSWQEWLAWRTAI
jgi:hypothetical protein